MCSCYKRYHAKVWCPKRTGIETIKVQSMSNHFCNKDIRKDISSTCSFLLLLANDSQNAWSRHLRYLTKKHINKLLEIKWTRVKQRNHSSKEASTSTSTRLTIVSEWHSKNSSSRYWKRSSLRNLLTNKLSSHKPHP